MRWRMPGVARRSPLSIWSMRANSWSVSDSTSRLVRGLFTLRRYDALAAGRGMHGLFSLFTRTSLGWKTTGLRLISREIATPGRTLPFVGDRCSSSGLF